METLTYSSNEDSALNEARLDYWAARYMLGESNRNPNYDKACCLRSVSSARRRLLQVATQYRERLNSKKLYRVPLIGEHTSHHLTILAFSAVNAQCRASLVAGNFAVGEPVCVE